MRRFVIIAGIVISLLALTLYATRSSSSTREVDVMPAERVETLQSLVTASGEIVAARYADIGAAVMGRLIDLPVKEGEVVRAGQVVARIDPVQAASSAAAADASLGAVEADARAATMQVRAAQAALAEAQSRAAQAAAALSRARELRNAGLLPAADFDAAVTTDGTSSAQVSAAAVAIERAQQAAAAAERRVTQAVAERTRARDSLNKTEVTAPIDGIVTRLEVEPGEMVVIGVQNQPGTTLMTISDLSAVNAEVRVAEADVMRISSGLSSTIIIEALPGERFTGRVVEVGASALPAGGGQAAAREFRVRIRIDGAGTRLRPGLTCDVDIVAAERRNPIVVPLQAVVTRNGTTGVFVVDRDTARFSAIATGIIGGLSVEVTGLSEGASVVTGPIQGLRDLRDGERIRVRTAPR